MTSPYLRIDELADYIKRQNAAQARRWVKFAKVPTKRVGRGLLVRKDHVEAALSSPDGKFHVTRAEARS